VLHESHIVEALLTATGGSSPENLLDSQPPQILLLSGVRGDTRRYRTFHLFEQLQLARVGSSLAHVTDPDLPARFERASLVVFHRVRWDGYVERLVGNLKKRAGLAIFGSHCQARSYHAYAWINSPDFADPVRSALYREDLRRNRLTLETCQAATASTEFLSEQVRRLGKPAWVHRNAFSLEMLALSEAAYHRRPVEGGKLVVGYASGTPTHNRDFELVKPALQELLGRYPRVELHLVGDLDPGVDWGSLSGRIHSHRLVPWRQLPALLAGFDINSGSTPIILSASRKVK
jgi:glycosyltransferase involved in cell wall biosynthesis